MWEKLIEVVIKLVSKKMLESPLHRRLLARRVATLYVNLIDCHDSYKHFIRLTESHTAETFAYYDEWIEKLRIFIENLADLSTIIDLFDNDLYQALIHYIDEEGIEYNKYRRFYGVGSSIKNDLGEDVIRFLYSLLSGEYEGNVALNISQKDVAFNYDDCKSAINGLGYFIKTNFRIDEIFEHI